MALDKYRVLKSWSENRLLKTGISLSFDSPYMLCDEHCKLYSQNLFQPFSSEFSLLQETTKLKWLFPAFLEAGFWMWFRFCWSLAFGEPWISSWSTWGKGQVMWQPISCCVWFWASCCGSCFQFQQAESSLWQGSSILGGLIKCTGFEFFLETQLRIISPSSISDLIPITSPFLPI